MNTKAIKIILISFFLTAANMSQAALFISDPAQFGNKLNTASSCDDCSEAITFPGSGQSINFFGTTYTGGFATSNGLVNFGSTGYDYFAGTPLDSQTDAPMIAGYWTDLVPSTDAGEGVFVNDSTPGQLVVTWNKRRYIGSSSTRSTFQIVIRSAQFSIPSGEGQIGYFYDVITDTATGTAGFGDGLAAVNPGEVGFHNGPGTDLSNAAPRWYTLGPNGVPIDPSATPPVATAIPTLSEWAMIFMASIMAMFGIRRMRRGN
jgi:hypothetical protein